MVYHHYRTEPTAFYLEPVYLSPHGIYEFRGAGCDPATITDADASLTLAYLEWFQVGCTNRTFRQAIVAGERDPKVLASFRQANCKADEATIVKALTGSWREEHLFVLKQSLELFDFFTTQITACDTEIERQFSAIKPRWDAPSDLPPLPPVKSGSKTKNKPAESTCQELFRIVGVDCSG